MSDPKSEFALAHNVSLFRDSTRHVGKILRSAGATNQQASPIYQSPYNGNILAYGFSEAFDHLDIWGRDRKPLILVGHPYGEPDMHREIYDAIAALGLEVRLDGVSYYGYGTYQVCVFAKEYPLGKN